MDSRQGCGQKDGKLCVLLQLRAGGLNGPVTTVGNVHSRSGRLRIRLASLVAGTRLASSAAVESRHSSTRQLLGSADTRLIWP